MGQAVDDDDPAEVSGAHARRPQDGPQDGTDIDPRLRSAWRTWLSALASDAEAAMAAALAYDSLPADGRDAWLDALDADAPTLAVPRLALYAPLLAVETCERRRERIELALKHAEKSRTSTEIWAMRGVGPDGAHVCAIVSPLYLDFVEVLVCHYTPSSGFKHVRHEPLRHKDDTPTREIDGVVMEPTPLRVVVEELAHAVLADRRERREAPSALTSFAHLFGPTLEDGDE
jgi:hypothetical protein